MTSDFVIDIGQRALEVTALISAPILLAALLLGLCVGIFQAATSINENTLSFIPKLVAMTVVLIAAGPWMLHTLVDFTRGLIESIPLLVNS